MPTTRSASNSVASAARLATAAPNGRKRKTVDISIESNKSANGTEPLTPTRVKRTRSTNKKPQADDFNEEPSEISETRTQAKKSTSPRKRSAKSAVEHGSVTPKPFVSKYFLDLDPDTTVIPARLSFDFEEAKAHLIAEDERFEEVFRKLKCKPFENLEPVDPFRSLVLSIVAQQISWLAARSIIHRFRRLYDPSLPEKPSPDGETSDGSFPTPTEVANTDIATLRAVGLSQRKAEYIGDVAKHFEDGRLSAVRLAQADDEVMEQDLIAVRGIGKWTVHMFAMFSLRRPNILAVGDLGLQKGILRWVLSSYTGSPLTIQPKKLPTASDKQDAPSSSLPQSQTDSSMGQVQKDASTLPFAPSDASEPSPPPSPIKGRAARPKVNGTGPDGGGTKGVELPSGMTIEEVKRRLSGKKPNKNYYVNPEEFEFLTKDWVPYRSLGCYYLWALGEDS